MHSIANEALAMATMGGMSKLTKRLLDAGVCQMRSLLTDVTVKKALGDYDTAVRVRLRHTDG